MDKPVVFRTGTKTAWRSHWAKLIGLPLFVFIWSEIGRASDFADFRRVAVITSLCVVSWMIHDRIRLDRERIEFYSDRIEMYTSSGMKTVLANTDIEGLHAGSGLSDPAILSRGGIVTIPAGLATQDDLMLRLDLLAQAQTAPPTSAVNIGRP